MKLIYHTFHYLLMGVVAGAIAGLPMPSQAQDASDPFKWNQLTISVSFSPGGTYDLYARLLSRHIGRHLPDNPSAIVVNRPGAGGLTMTNYMYLNAPKDGTEIGMIPRAISTEPLLLQEKSKALFEPDKFVWIGSMNKEVSVFVFWQEPPLTLEDLVSGREITFAATGATSDAANFARAFNRLLGARLKVIAGYPGSAEMLMAMEKREIEGTNSSWSALKVDKADWLHTGKAKPVVQMAIARDAEIPDVPAIKELVKDERDKLVVDLLFSTQELGRPIVAPPDLVQGRGEALRRAFVASMEDRELVSDASRLGFDLNWVSGEEAQALINRLVQTPSDVLKRAAEISAN